MSLSDTQSDSRVRLHEGCIFVSRGCSPPPPPPQVRTPKRRQLRGPPEGGRGFWSPGVQGSSWGLFSRHSWDRQQPHLYRHLQKQWLSLPWHQAGPPGKFWPVLRRGCDNAPGMSCLFPMFLTGDTGTSATVPSKDKHGESAESGGGNRLLLPCLTTCHRVTSILLQMLSMGLEQLFSCYSK